MALEVNLDVTLEANRVGSTVNIVNDVLQVAAELYDEHAAHVIEVADGAADQAISLGGLTTVEALVLFSDREITVKVNGSADGIQCTSLVLVGTSITSLSVSNASGGQATPRVYLFGT